MRHQPPYVASLFAALLGGIVGGILVSAVLLQTIYLGLNGLIVFGSCGYMVATLPGWVVGAFMPEKRPYLALVVSFLVALVISAFLVGFGLYWLKGQA
jgi:hypothetical protein